MKSLILGLGREIHKMNLEHLLLPENKEVRDNLNNKMS